MLRIGGINVIGVLLGTIAFYLIGYIFYGVLFVNDWTAHTLAATSVAELDSIRQMTPERLDAAWHTAFPNYNAGMTYGLGFLNAFVTVSVLAIVLRLLTAGAPSIMSYAGLALLLAIGFATTSLLYDHIYAGKALALLWIDMGHIIVAYVLSATILSVLE